jgi:hypothetical protein
MDDDPQMPQLEGLGPDIEQAIEALERLKACLPADKHADIELTLDWLREPDDDRHGNGCAG